MTDYAAIVPPPTTMYKRAVALDLRFHPGVLEFPWENRREMRFLSVATGRAHTVEKGFFFDLATVPRLPVAYMLFGGQATLASLWHDKLYRDGIGTKEEADIIFAEIMDLAGDPSWRRFWMFHAVRVFGRGNFEDDHGNLIAGFATGNADG